MAVSGSTWFFLISSAISTGFNLTLFIILFVNFLRRKTIGTMILTLAFLATVIGEIMFSLTFWLQAFAPTIPIRYTGVIYYIGMTAFPLNTYFYYFFGNRHIIRDNDIIKSLVALALGSIIGITIGLGVPSILQNAEMPGVYILGELPHSDLAICVIGYYLAMALIPIAIFVVFGRIIYNGFVIRNQTKDTIIRKGFSFVLIASFFHLLGAATRTIGFWIKPVRDSVVLSIIVFGLGVVLTAIALTLYYLGWVMPDWLKRRFREKAWFTQVFTGKIAEPIDIVPNPEHNQEYTSQNTIEITDR